MRRVGEIRKMQMKIYLPICPRPRSESEEGPWQMKMQSEGRDGRPCDAGLEDVASVGVKVCREWRGGGTEGEDG